ncbi:MAG: hypothetical protein K2O34_01975 [Acetatifactor sp.]|nr:hypothetical protein [Acetatifactor sp.]
MPTHCLSSRELLRCGWQEGFKQTEGGLAVDQEDETGLFVSRIYDSGREGTQWNRIWLDIAEKAAIEVYVWLFDTAKETEEKPENLRLWYERQKGNARYNAQYHFNYRSMILYGCGGGRYARLAVEIQPGRERDTLFGGYDLSFPKESFTRYLPAIYRNNLPLERFLAVQQDIYLNLETAVDTLAEKLDYERCSGWQAARLARWMGWGELAAKKTPLGEETLRKLLQTGIALTGRKGTCAYYTGLTEILTGRKAVMVEEPEKCRAVVLVLGEPEGNWERCRSWLKKNTVMGIDMDFIVLHRTDRLDERCFLDKTAGLSKYESELTVRGCPIECLRLL